MRTKNELWQMFEPYAHEMGLEIFEIEVPNSRSSVLRIYLARNPESLVQLERATTGDELESQAVGEDNPVKRGVSLDECALFSKTLSRLEGFEDFFHDRWTLEVSSPGINRKLTRPEHFRGALGERVKVKFRGDEQRTVVAKGVLSQFDGATLTIDDEERGAPVMVEFAQVNEARVDFLFTRER